MKYTFVIPTYNKKEPLEKSLQALNYFPGYGPQDYEVVVVDDGSKDAIFEKIKGINRNYCLNYVYLQRSENSCRSRARNYGIQLARGNYIIFIDDDIVVNNNYLSELDRFYSFADNLVIIGTRLSCPTHLIDGADIKELRKAACQGTYIDRLELRHPTFNRLSYNLNSQKYPWMMAFSSNIVVPRKSLVEINGFDENFKNWGFEDLELGYRLHKFGLKFVINSRLEAFHQSHPMSIKGEDNYVHFLKACRDVFKVIEPGDLMSLHALGTDDPGLLAKFRKYQGKIKTKNLLEFRESSQLEVIKKNIITLSRKKGEEIIVNDYCENTDLDIWIQLFEVKNALISYFPQSFKISNEKCIELFERIIFNKDITSFR
ncbi:MAG: glycosyltransferase [Acidobacteria bacterium]|nr:glycosyltransferase [Acidobacteriota bacterium]